MNCINKFIWFLSIMTGIFFVIGITTFLLGCDSTLQPKCLNYNVVNANISRYIINNLTCSSCVSQITNCQYINKMTTCYTTCIQQQLYNCFAVYVEFTFGDNMTCTRNIRDGVANLDLSYTYEYPIKKTYELYISKTDGNCYFNDMPKKLAIVGFVFLILTGCTLLLCISICISHKKNQVKNLNF